MKFIPPIKVIVPFATLVGLLLIAMFWNGRSGDKAVEAGHQRSPQTDPSTSCGPVSVAVVSHYLGAPGTIAQFHRETRAGQLGHCSMSDLLRALRLQGFAAEALHYPGGVAPGHGLPMILHVDHDHFLVAIGVPSGRVVLLDPPRQPAMLRWSDLSERWDGSAIVVAKSEARLRVALDSPKH